MERGCVADQPQTPTKDLVLLPRNAFEKIESEGLVDALSLTLTLSRWERGS
ncbi:MAG: hypothetical protein JWM68_4690, partial [Verrucomicrobiales bacterium]|nr:hypothetical protein [Verrucomicrobiales bacterium]